jgi:hypothetical protein
MLEVFDPPAQEKRILDAALPGAGPPFDIGVPEDPSCEPVEDAQADKRVVQEPGPCRLGKAKKIVLLDLLDLLLVGSSL